MCLVKNAKDITSKEEVRNLITSIILRQRNPYKEEDIVKATTDYLKGSSLKLEYDDISQLVENSLDIFVRSGSIRCWNGMYRTMGIN